MALLVDDARRVVIRHLASARERVARHVRIGVELREVLLERGGADREHDGLIAVVTAAPVSGTHDVRHRELRDLFAVTEDPERSPSRQHLAPAELARGAASHGEAVVGNDLFGAEGELRVWRGYRGPRTGLHAALNVASFLHAAAAASARSRNGRSAARNASVRSTCGRWPQSSMSSTCAWGITFSASATCSTGSTLSCLPQITRTGPANRDASSTQCSRSDRRTPKIVTPERSACTNSPNDGKPYRSASSKSDAGIRRE